MADENGKAKSKRDDAGYEKERQRTAAISRQKSASGRDIGEIPAVFNPERREACAKSFELFCRVYFPETFYLPWSNDHREAIRLIEEVTIPGGLFALAMPRGSGKSSLCEEAVLWATLYGLRLYPFLVSADATAAAAALDSIKTELESNELLLEDFPEVCHPIRSLDGIAHRANGQLCNGAHTHIGWTADSVVFPTIMGSIASAAVLEVSGITAGFRGKKFKRPDGKTVRPDLLICDDCQTNESARSPTQCAERIKLLRGAILGLAGPGKKISGIMPCTVIEHGDMADQILDREKHPEWQGRRTKMVYKFPTADGLWEQYKKIRSDGMRAGNGGSSANSFYQANREAMDAGSEVAWPVRFNHDELSAIQHAMNLRADVGDQAFFAEYQNDPIQDQEGTREYLTAEEISAKVNGKARGVVPQQATKLTAFIDVQKELLIWMVCGFEEDFTGYVVDYGTFPDQHREYFARSDAKQKLAKVLGAKSTEEAIYQGVLRLTSDLIDRDWPREDGTVCRIDRLNVDARWGESTDVIYKFCRDSVNASIISPSFGYAVSAAGKSFREYKRKPGDEVGDHWMRPNPEQRRGIRKVLFDANYYKTFVNERLAVPIGGRGCLSLFGSDPGRHKMLADHITAEAGIKVSAKGRTVTEWKLKNHRPDNDLLDCLSGCHVAASMLRISLAERAPAPAGLRRKVKFSQLQRK